MDMMEHATSYLRLNETSDSRKLRYKIDIDWFERQYKLPEVKIPRSSLVIHFKAGHAQLNRKSAISGL